MILFLVGQLPALIQLPMTVTARPCGKNVMRLQCAAFAVDVLVAVRCHDRLRIAVANAINTNLAVLPLRSLQVMG